MRSIFQCILVFLVLLPVPSWAQEALTLTWNPPTTNTDGSPLQAGELAGYRLYTSLMPIPDDKGSAQLIATIPEGTSVVTVDVPLPEVGARVYFRVLAFAINGRESLLSNEVSESFLTPVTVILQFVPFVVPVP